MLLNLLNKNNKSDCMAIWHGEEGRTPTGALKRRIKKKRKYELGNIPTFTKIGKDKRKKIRAKGGFEKIKVFSTEFANVLDPETKKVQKVKIEDIVDNPASKDFIRRKIITKGAIIKTELGEAKVTSRPGQDGVVNAVLLKKE